MGQITKTRLRSLDDIDGRTTAARQARDLIAALTSDLGGEDHLSAAQTELVRRAALLGAYVAHCEANWLAGADVDVSAWLSAVDRQRHSLRLKTGPCIASSYSDILSHPFFYSSTAATSDVFYLKLPF